MGTNTSSNYNRISKKCCGGIRGLRLNPRKFSVQRLRTNFLYLFRLLRRWKNSYKNTLRQLRRNLGRNKRKEREIQLGYVNVYSSTGIRTMTHSNSFCSEAIADCLEFIKRNSVSVDDESNPMLDQD